MLSSLLFCILITLGVWKYTKFGRLLKPKVRKKEIKLEDLIVPADENARAEGDMDLDLNPVVQARMIIENDVGGHGGFKATAGRYGALRKLLVPLGVSQLGSSSTARKGKKDKKAALKQLDRNLAKEGKQAEAEMRLKEEEERIFRQAERAALEAKRRIF